MSKLLAVEYRNFQSYGNAVTRINLDFVKAVLVVGRNMDSVVEGQIDSNGSGKSAIRQAIIFGAFGQTITPASGEKLKQDDLLNIFNGENMMVALEMLADDGFYYRIERYYKDEKFKNGVYLLRKKDPNVKWNRKPEGKGGHDVTEAGKRDVNKEIVRIIGLPFSVFSRLIVISATHTPFLSLDLSAQREIMEELFGFTELSEKAEELKEWMKANKAELSALERLDEQIQSEHDRYNKNVMQAESMILNWDVSHTDQVTALEKKITDHIVEHGDTDFDVEEEKFHDIAKLETNITEANGKIKLASAELNTVETQLDNIKGWDKVRAKELKIMVKALDEPLLFNSEEEIDAFNQELDNYDKAINTLSGNGIHITAKIVDIDNDTKLIHAEIKSKDHDLTTHLANIQRINSELSALDESKCPYCTQHFVADNNKLDSLTNERAASTQTVSDTTTDISLLRHEVSEQANARRVLEEEAKTYAEHIEALTNGRRQFLIDILGSDTINLRVEYQKTRERAKLVIEYERKKAEPNPFLKFGSVDELESRIATTNAAIRKLNQVSNKQKVELEILAASLTAPSLKELTQMKYQLDAWNDELKKIQMVQNPFIDGLTTLRNSPPSDRKTAEIDELKDMLEHQDVVLKLLTKKDSFIRKALLNRYLPKLNKRVRYYLAKIGMPHKVEFQQDMTVTIHHSRTPMKFAQMSAGQAARINIALAFAFRDILQSRFGSLNFCVLDECLDVGLGSVGVQLAAKMVKAIAKENQLSMLVISHKDEIASMFDARLTVELKNRFSSVVQSDI